MSDPTFGGERLGGVEGMLVDGAWATGRNTITAAVHLLVFTDLPRRPGFDDLFVVEYVHREGDGVRVPAAFVRDWKELARFAGKARLHGAQQRLVDFAVGLATGKPVDLTDAINLGGHAHARRLIEAVAIATGYASYYAVTPTPKLEEMLAEQARMLP